MLAAVPFLHIVCSRQIPFCVYRHGAAAAVTQGSKLSCTVPSKAWQQSSLGRRWDSNIILSRMHLIAAAALLRRKGIAAGTLVECSHLILCDKDKFNVGRQSPQNKYPASENNSADNMRPSKFDCIVYTWLPWLRRQRQGRRYKKSALSFLCLTARSHHTSPPYF